MQATANSAAAHTNLAEFATQLQLQMHALAAATKAIWTFDGPPNAREALANAVPYMQAFGHVVLAWIWLDVAVTAASQATPANAGRLAACTYFYNYELPKTGAWLGVAQSRDQTCAGVAVEAF
jgi:butyryl-CoA dehydrogenase